MDIAFSIQSPFNFDETIQQLKIQLSNVHFSVLWELNFKDKLSEKGFTFTTNFKVLEACNPAQAYQVLSTNIEAGYFLPCKLVVYERENQIYMGMIPPTQLIRMLPDASITLLEIAESVENSLKSAMENVRKTV